MQPFSKKDLGISPSRYINRGFTLLLWLLCVAFSGVIFWAAFRGFDLSDEGLYLMSFLYPEESNIAISFQYFIQQWFGAFQPGLVAFRILRLFLTLGATLLFAWGFVRWVNRQSKLPYIQLTLANTFPFLLLGSFMSYSLYPQALSYNSFTLILLSLATGCLLLFLSGKSKHRFWWLLATGSLVGFEFFVKFPVSVLSFLLIGFVLLLHCYGRRAGWIGIFRFYAILLLGAALPFIWFTLTLEPLTTWFPNFIESTTSLASHDLASILARYWESVTISFSVGPLNFLFFIFASVLALTLYRYGMLIQRKSTLILLLISIFATMLFKGLTYHWLESGKAYSAHAFDPYLVVFVLLLLSLMVTSSLKGLLKKHAPLLALSSVLILLPFLSSFGTNNDLTEQSLQYLLFWFAMALLLILMVEQNLNASGLSPVVCGVLALLALGQVYSGLIEHPYRSEQALTSYQNTLRIETTGETLLVDSTVASYIHTIREALAEQTHFQSGDPMIDLQANPGTQFALGGAPVGSSWYMQGEPKLNCYNLKQSSLKHLQKLVILCDQKKPISTTFKSCLQAKGVNFPDDFKRILLLNHYRLSEVQTAVLVPKSLLKKD